MAAILKAHGRIDGLVNNAGGQFQAPLEAITQKGWETVVRTNLTGGFLMARECYTQWMREHGGAIVNIVADMWNGMPGMGHSGAARAGMVNFTETAAAEWGARRRARQCRGAGLDRLLRLRHLSRQRQAHAALAAPAHAAAAPRHGGRGLRGHRLPAVAGRRLHLRRRPCASTAPPPTPSAMSSLPPHDRSKPWNGFHRAVLPKSCRRSDVRGRNRRSRIAPTCREIGAIRLTPIAPIRCRMLMAIIQSRIDPNSEAFRANRRDMLALVEQFRALEQRVRDTSNQKLPMFQKRGQLTPRQRLAHLLDRGSPFLELSTLAGLNMHDDDGAENIQGGGVIAGIGYVAACAAVITASDSGIKGGTIAPMGLRKTLRVQEIVMRNKLPFISLVESGGANLNYQAEIFVDGGRTFANMARMSAMGIPHVTVVHGSSTAGGAYHPGLSDYVVVVREGQDLPRRPAAAQGRHRRGRHRRGAGRRRDARHGLGHRRVPGRGRRRRRCDIAREIMAALPWNERLPPLPRKAAQGAALRPRRAAAAWCPVDYRKPYDVREVIARLVDDSRLPRLQAALRRRRPCAGRPTIEGQAVGFIGNNGPIDAEGAVKAAQFIQLCDQADTPLVFLQNTTGLHGRQRGRARRHRQARLQDDPGGRQRAGAEAHPAHRRQLRRRQLRHVRARLDPRFIFAWPNSRIAVMGRSRRQGAAPSSPRRSSSATASRSTRKARRA